MRKLVFILLGMLIVTFSIPKTVPVDDDVGIELKINKDVQNIIQIDNQVEQRAVFTVIKGPLDAEVIIPLYKVSINLDPVEKNAKRIITRKCT